MTQTKLFRDCMTLPIVYGNNHVEEFPMLITSSHPLQFASSISASKWIVFFRIIFIAQTFSSISLSSRDYLRREETFRSTSKFWHPRISQPFVKGAFVFFLPILLTITRFVNDSKCRFPYVEFIVFKLSGFSSFECGGVCKVKSTQQSKY